MLFAIDLDGTVADWEGKMQSSEQFRENPDILLTLSVIPGAVEYLTTLANQGTVGYYTVRKSDNAQCQADIQNVTKRWLSEKQFPNPQEVTFCMSVMNKLIRLYRHIQATQQHVVLVDDLHEIVLTSFEQLKAGKHPKFNEEACRAIAATLQEHLTLVAFGASSLPEEYHGLHVVALPSWKSASEFFIALIRANSSVSSH